MGFYWNLKIIKFYIFWYFEFSIFVMCFSSLREHWKVFFQGVYGDDELFHFKLRSAGGRSGSWRAFRFDRKQLGKKFFEVWSVTYFSEYSFSYVGFKSFSSHVLNCKVFDLLLPPSSTIICSPNFARILQSLKAFYSCQVLINHSPLNH